MSTASRLALAGALGVAALALGQSAAAHPIGVSRGEYRATAQGLEAVLVLSRRELGAEPASASSLAALVAASAAGSPCALDGSGARALEADGVELVLRYACPHPEAPRYLNFAGLFDQLSHGHRHEARVTRDDGSVSLAVLFKAQPGLLVPARAGATPSPRAAASFFQFTRMGVEHILSGYDHLVFLLGLVIVGPRLRQALAVVSAFTFAHSLTLAAAVLGLVSPSSRLVEPAIALSVAYVGVENLLTPRPRRRVWLALLFGLVHGFGFSSALSDVHFGGRALALALAAFNLGVEIGQLAVLCALAPLLGRLVQHQRFGARVATGVSGLVALLGLFWFALRVGA